MTILVLSLTFFCLVAFGWPALAQSRPQPVAMHRVIVRVFGPRWRAAECIARAESNLDPRAISPGGGNYGLFQVNVVHRSWLNWSRILDPEYNARAAYRLSHGGTNWRPWTTHWECGV